MVSLRRGRTVGAFGRHTRHALRTASFRPRSAAVRSRARSNPARTAGAKSIHARTAPRSRREETAHRRQQVVQQHVRRYRPLESDDRADEPRVRGIERLDGLVRRQRRLPPVRARPIEIAEQHFLGIAGFLVERLRVTHDDELTAARRASIARRARCVSPRGDARPFVVLSIAARYCARGVAGRHRLQTALALRRGRRARRLRVPGRRANGETPHAAITMSVRAVRAFIRAARARDPASRAARSCTGAAPCRVATAPAACRGGCGRRSLDRTRPPARGRA